MTSQKEKPAAVKTTKKEPSPPPEKPVEPVVAKEGKFNINTASQSQLESIKGIGPSKAKAILSYIETHGPFADITEVVKVKGIGKKTAEKIALQAFASP